MTKKFIENEMRPYLKLRGLLREERKKLESELLKNKSKDKFDEFFKSYKDGFGVCSFSWKNDNIVLWANYADNHSGVCLGFNGLAPVIEGLYSIVPVEYTLYIEKYIFTSFEDKNYWQHWLCTKAKDWEYEDEVRLVSKSHNGLLGFPKENLTEIYLGLSMPIENKKKVIDSLIRNKYSSNTKLYQMAIDKERFILKPQEIKWTVK